MKNSAHLTIDNIPYGIGYPLPSNQYQNFISVNLNGENIKLDIMDIDAVVGFMSTYDYGYMNLIPVGSNKIYVYNYKTKTTIQFSYTKEMKLEDLLKATGFTNAETGVACYTKTGYNNYKVTAVNSHLHKIGLTRQELVSFMKTLNGLDLMFFEGILKIPHDDWTSEEIFIRYSTIMYLFKTKTTQITMVTGVVIDATNTFESTKLLEELGYPQFLTDTIGMNYRSSRVGTTFSELITMDVIARGEEVRNAVDFAITYLFMRLNSNLRFGSDNAFVDVSETESPGIGGTGSKTLFRGDKSVSPEGAFDNGISPKGTGDNLLDHVSGAKPGNFVSTSEDISLAKIYAGDIGESYVYEIKTSNYIDVNKTLGNKSPYPVDMEFSIPGGILPSEIRGVWILEDGLWIGKFIPNSRYGGK